MTVPAWFWAWARWRDRGATGPRPSSAPKRIPAWAWARYDLHRPKPVPPPPPKTIPTVFHGASVWIGDMDAFAIEYLPLMDGFASLVMPVLDGLDPVPLRLDRKAQFEQAGKLVLSSSWCKGDDAFAEGQYAAHLCHEGRFAGHWANAEKAFDSNGGRVAASLEWLNGWFDSHRKLGVPPAPLGVTPEPFSGMDHGAWQNAGAAYGPQAYTVENGATIASVVAWGVRCGWQPSQMVPLVEPVIGDRETPAADYARDAKTAGLPGLVLYRGDQLANRPDVWHAIAEISR